MSRNPIQTVTRALPILVEVTKLGEEADGRANFLSGDRAEAFTIRIVRKGDIKARLKTIFPGKEIELFTGAVQLKQAFETGDEFLMQQASEKARPWLADFVALRDSKIQSADGRFSFEIRGMKKYSALLNYARLMADMLQSARLVMWFSEKDGRFLPSVYCPDWKTAAFAMAFAGRLRVCPKCSEIFTQKGDNNDYCRPSHRESHRMARARWRKKQNVKKTRRK